MVDLVGVALFDARQRGLGQGGLDPHHRVGILRRPVFGLADQAQHRRHVRDVALPDLHGSGIGLAIVIAVGKSEAPRRNPRDHLIRVSRVLVGAEAEQSRLGAAAVAKVRRRQPAWETLLVSQGRNRFKVAPERRYAKLLHRGLIHARREVVANLLPLRRPSRFGLRGFLEDPP